MTLSSKFVPARNGFLELRRSVAVRLSRYLAPANIAIIAVVAFSYFIVGRLGLRPETPNHNVTAIWLPAGIALAALLLRGIRVWPGVYLGAFLLSVSVTGHVSLSLVMAASTTLGGVIGASLIKKFANGTQAFFKTADVLRFIFFGAVLTPTLCATFGVSLLCKGGFATSPEFSTLWFTWWVGDMLGILFLAPFLVLLLGHKHHSPAPLEKLEITALVAGLSLVCVLNFGLRPVSWIPGQRFSLPLCSLLGMGRYPFLPLGSGRSQPHHGRIWRSGVPCTD